MAGVFTLENAVKRGPSNYVRMRAAQMNARAVGRVFNLFPESVFLVAGEGSVELRTKDRRFHTDVVDSSLVWICDGDSLFFQASTSRFTVARVWGVPARVSVCLSAH